MEEGNKEKEEMAAALERARTAVLDCPICGKKLKTDKVSKMNSVKSLRCASHVIYYIFNK